MKLIKRFVFAVLFVSALAVNTYGGEQETPGYSSPAPPTHSTIAVNETTPSSGSEDSQPADSADISSDTLFYEALAALMSIF
jgi:hypothetical protein